MHVHVHMHQVCTCTCTCISTFTIIHMRIHRSHDMNMHMLLVLFASWLVCSFTLVPVSVDAPLRMPGIGDALLVAQEMV